ncbi:SIR2-like domain-containing protein [Cupriavidus sp. YR651]|uniref:DUF4062 domain-containing protein n=1 Tax=Cupriavidus sp. YR651 TaxID=1855315 RepID=UPI0008908676|nr:DUF4062 domain-containing protein [Cupriavidus sp. YR651]SDC54150.1 SIR2-like domain-containing protein [Cupriavidus sp. YR651]
MSTKVRAFISSTMEDLQNERRAVVKSLKGLGIDPVFAEEFSPTGESSWEVIREKMEQCHVCVLILGTSYGWNPTSGYGAGQKKSVTHLEFDYARELGIPVIAFMKKLSYGTKPDEQRDNFRKEVSDWHNGLFRTEFEWADDLAEKASSAFVSLWTNSFLKEHVRSRDSKITPVPAIPRPSQEGARTNTQDSEWVLVAGAGLSIIAGYPTAYVLTTALARFLWPSMEDTSDLYRYNFSEVASLLEARLGRAKLLDVVEQTMNPPQHVRPTVAHQQAVLKFKAIVTTNFDTLFELACIEKNVPYEVITPDSEAPATNDGRLRIYKMNGSITDLKSLCLTTADLRAIENRPVFQSLRALLSTSRVAVVGHSLRDGNMAELMEDRNRNGDRSVYVSPAQVEVDDITLARFNLIGVRQNADDFLESFDPTLN